MSVEIRVRLRKAFLLLVLAVVESDLFLTPPLIFLPSSGCEKRRHNAAPPELHSIPMTAG